MHASNEKIDIVTRTLNATIVTPARTLHGASRGRLDVYNIIKTYYYYHVRILGATGVDVRFNGCIPNPTVAPLLYTRVPKKT